MNKRQVVFSIILGSLIILFSSLAILAGPKSSSSKHDPSLSLSETPDTIAGSAPLDWPEKIPSREMAAFFGNSNAPPRLESQAIMPIPVQQEPITIGRERIDWIHFVGTMTDPSGKLRYYFKDNRTGRIEALVVGEATAPWTLMEMTHSLYILEIDGREYEILR